MTGSPRSWTQRWWKLMERRIGIVPLPVHLLLLAVLWYFVASGQVPTEINMMIAVLAVLGFSCAEIGHRLPVVNQIGGAAIFATFIPSYLTFRRFGGSTLARDRSGTLLLFRNIFAYKPAIEPFHRLSSNVD